MTPQLCTAAFVVAVLGAACTGGAGAKTGSGDRIAELCNSTTNMGEGLCRCVGEKASTGLSAPAQEFLVATLDKKDDDVIAELRGKMNFEEIMKAGMFMTTAPAQCAKESATTLPEDQS